VIEFFPEAAGAVVEDSQAPGLIVPVARRLARRLTRKVSVRWGSLRRTEPFSSEYGFDRGLPIDRFYIEGFLARNAEDIRGRVLEVHDAAYTRRFGADRITDSEILDIDAANPDATLIADLAEARSLRAEHFDCVILTQTLQYVSDPEAVLQNVWQSLAPGGTALITVPCLSRIDPELPATDRWRFTPRGLEALLARACPSAEVEVLGCGNVLAGVAFLMGLAAQELSRSELEHEDADFPLVSCARVRKRG
jgi:SAM-dependent methyltransferase